MWTQANRIKHIVPAGLRRRVRERLLAAPSGNPRHIPADLGVAGVVAELNRRDVRYAILRWHDHLPDLPPGGDLDLLVHDDDIGEVDRLLGAEEGIAECDVYSVSGLAGTAYSGVPHLLPDRAAEVLDSAILLNGIYRIPRAEDYFLSLAFHSVYHKGFKTGLASRYPAPTGLAPPKNDYYGTLAKLAAELGLGVDLSLDGLDRFLAARGWGATPEMLVALARRNAWAAARLDEQRQLQP